MWTKAWTGGAVFVMLTSLLRAQAPPGPRMNLELQLPRQASAPVAGMQPQPVGQIDVRVSSLAPCLKVRPVVRSYPCR